MTFYFYDLETSGISSRAQRIMQFAGQRTDADFNPIGEPDNWMIRLTDEILPDPEAILVTGITPQKTLEEGYTEAEFLKLFTEQVCQPDTVITGFNNVRFDDEFMRSTLWRNFYDPYEWQWQDGRSRWDLMDVVRMVRALRPEGIEWPFDVRPISAGDHGRAEAKDGEKTVKVPSNRLELLTEANGLGHDNAHDALSDVHATIAVAKLLRAKQSKMFDYLLSMRSKQAVAKLVDPQNAQPFLYTSGRYSNDFQKTTAAVSIAAVEHGNVLVYDLRVDPDSLDGLGEDELSARLFTRSEDGLLPVKVLKPNACPVVAPLGVLDNAAEKNIKLTTEQVATNYSKLLKTDLRDRVRDLYEKRQAIRKGQFAVVDDPDFQLYDGFVDGKDKQAMRVIRAADVSELSDNPIEFNDSRLSKLLPRYKARNFPRSLNQSEQAAWEEYRAERIIDGVSGQQSLQEFAAKLAELAQQKTDDTSQFLLQELQLYAESVAPINDL